MKNKILIILLSLVTLGVSAQVTTDSVLHSKKGIPILPQKGDWAIGVDALPYLNFAGNIFNNTSGNTLDLGSQTIYGRYFVANNAAIRLMISVNQGSSLGKYYVRDDAAFFADPLSRAQTEDALKHKYTGFGLGIGYQKFRGYGKLRGFYGAQIGFNINRDQYEYTYGNPITVANAKPSMSWTYNSDNSRVLLVDNGYDYSAYIGGLAGVEYYFAPKICIGGEVTLSLTNSWVSQANSKYERLNGSVVETFEKATSPAGRTNTSLNSSEYSGVFGGSLYVIFHF